MRLPFLTFLAIVAAVSLAEAAVVADKDRFGNVDGRGALTEKAGQLGLSDGDVERLRGATGFVVCPGTEHTNGIVASAALVESAQVIVTVGHAFVDEQGRPRAPIETCVFRNEAEPAVEIPLAGAGAVWNGLDGAAKPHDPADYAVAVLSRPVPGAKPLRIRGDRAVVDERMIGIVAWQEMEPAAAEGVPVVQDCAVRDLDAAAGNQPTNYLTDCDLSRGGSGGHLIARAGREWVTSGVFSTSGGKLSVGRSFSRRLGSFTRVIAIDAGAISALEKALAAVR
ncbi:MAG TPA: hypothetical protein PK286_12965 [Devosia sp.]|nr:hypothetical protein [Devosia sp.]